jgi:hypothetical protein
VSSQNNKSARFPPRKKGYASQTEKAESQLRSSFFRCEDSSQMRGVLWAMEILGPEGPSYSAMRL